MAKTNITQYSSTPSSNTDINNINIDENCPASGLNNAIRELMAHLKNVDTGSQALTSPSFTAMSTDTISEKTSANGVAIDGVTLKDGGVGTTASPVALYATSLNGGQFGGRRNFIINGAMQVAQRGTSFSGVTASGTYPVDRFLFHVGSLGTWTLSQSTDVPTGQGFAKSIKCDVTTADASPTGTDYARIDHRFEGQDLQAFCKGTSNAKQFALSFYVKSPKTGTHIVELQDADNTRNISKAYTVSSANTWEKKELIIDADTTGAFDNDNAKSLTIAWWLSAGTDYKSGTLATTWGSPTNANRVVGQVNIADSTSNDFYLTGVQLEVGEQVTPFEFRSFGEELALCQRYYTVIADGVNAGGFAPIGMGAVYNSSTVYSIIAMPVEMRASPSIEIVDATNYYQLYSNNTGDPVNDFTLSKVAPNRVEFFNDTDVSRVAGHAVFIRTANASAKFALKAEL